METKNISGRETQAMTPFGTSPIPAPPSLKQTSYDGTMLKDRYLIEGELGRGGIGVVYLARDTQLMNRRVVVKVLLQESGNSLHNPWFKKKFEQEIEALVRLDHPGIVGVLDAGTMPDGKEFFVMQYVEGKTLRSLVSGQMDMAQVARIVVSANRNLERYAALGFNVVADDVVGFAGPLAGIAAIAARVETPWLLTVPVDCGDVPPRLLESLSAAGVDDVDVCVAHDGERRQPLFALYRVAAARMAPANEAVWRFQDGLRCREAHVAARFANRNTREGASC